MNLAQRNEIFKVHTDIMFSASCIVNVIYKYWIQNKDNSYLTNVTVLDVS